jgi:ComEC/Rec2-related protein
MNLLNRIVHLNHSLSLAARAMRFMTAIFPYLKLWSNFPAFLGWCALSLGIAAGFTWLTGIDYSFSSFYITAMRSAMVFVFLSGLLFSSRTVRFICFFAFGVLLALFTETDRHNVFNRPNPRLSEKNNAKLFGTIVSLPLKTKGNYSFIVKADSLLMDFQSASPFRKNVLCFSKQEPSVFQAAVLRGFFRIPRPPENPGIGADENLYCMENNVWGFFYADSVAAQAMPRSFFSLCAAKVRFAVKQALKNIDNEEYRGILSASFLNERGDITDTMKMLFVNAGIYHLLALSGFNIAILAGVMFAFLFFVPIHKDVKIAIVLVTIWFYLLFIGLIPSLFRAVIMMTVVCASFLIQKKSFPLNSLGVAGSIWLIMSPMGLLDPGFQLSFAATFGILTLSPIFLDYFKFRSDKRIIQWISNSFFMILSVSLASFIATMPVLVFHFNQIYLFGLFANLFAVSLMALSMWICCIGFIAQFFSSALAAFCMHGAEWILGLMIKGAALSELAPWSIARIVMPYPEIYCIFTFCILGFILIKKDFRNNYIAIAFPSALFIALLCLVGHGVRNDAHIAFLKTGKDYCTAVLWPNNRAWIIVNGPEMPSKSTYLKVITPWKNQFFKCAVEKILLPDFQGNSVHFLEPILKNEPGAQVVCGDQRYSTDEDFLTFLKVHKKKPVYFLPGESWAVARQCTCKTISTKSFAMNQTLSLVLHIFRSVVFIPDLKADNLEEYHNPWAMTINEKEVRNFIYAKNRRNDN